MGLDSVGNVHGIVTGKAETASVPTQTNSSVSAILNVSVLVKKWLPTSYLLKVTTSCVILLHQKLWCGTPFPHKYKI